MPDISKFQSLQDFLAAIDAESTTAAVDKLIADDLAFKAVTRQLADIQLYLGALSNYRLNNTIRDTRLPALIPPTPPEGFTAPPEVIVDDTARLQRPAGTIVIGALNQFGEYDSFGSNVSDGTLASTPDGVDVVLVGRPSFGMIKVHVWVPIKK